MRINRDVLVGIARNTISERIKSDYGILAAYVHGSVLSGSPFIGGTADVDIVIIHNVPPAVSREIVRINDNVHLDIAHHDEKEYLHPRQLRTHPWLGPTLFNAQVLYDPHHKMDFIQAGVRGLFDRPGSILQRAQPQVEHARQMWMEFVSKPLTIDSKVILKYFKALDHAVNGIALLSGLPLAERRLLPELPKRAEAAGALSLYGEFLTLLGSRQTDASRIQGWLSHWENAFDAIPDEKRQPRLNRERKAYYLKAIKATLDDEHPLDALWLFLKTWTLVIDSLPDSDQHYALWMQAMEHLGLGDAGFKQRLDEMDAFLDNVETVLDDWAETNGA